MDISNHHHTITAVESLPDYVLRVTFACGTVKLYDVKPMIARYEPFTMLTYVDRLFEQARVEVHGIAIVWNEFVDLDSEEVWYGGVTDDG